MSSPSPPSPKSLAPVVCTLPAAPMACTRHTRTVAGAAALAFGLVMVIVGASVASTYPESVRARLHASLVLGTGSAAPLVGARLAAGVFGGPAGSQPRAVAYAAGNAPDVNDTGAAVDLYVPNITNVEAALLGAQPAVAEVGPVAYRRYSLFNYSCADCGVSAQGVQTFFDRTSVRFDADASAPGVPADRRFGGAWDSSYITVPNAGMRDLESRLASLHPALSSLEAFAVPLFSLQAVAQLLPALEYALRVETFPLMASAMLEAAYVAVRAAGGNAGYLLPRQFVSNSGPFLAPGLTLGQDYTDAAAPGPMSIAVYGALFGYASPTPYVGLSAVSPLSPAGWRLTIPALTACPAAPAGATCGAYIAAFMGAVNGFTPGTYAGPADARLTRDAFAVLQWYRRILGSPAAPYGDTYAGYAAGAINSLQHMYGIEPDVVAWPDAVWSQLTNNGVQGVLAAYSVYFSARAAGAANETAMAATTAAAPALLGAGAPNLCAESQQLSLLDVLPASTLPGVGAGAVPELSCYISRAGAGGFGAKLSASALRAVLGTAADAAVASAAAPVAASLRGGGLFPSGPGGAGLPRTEGLYNSVLFAAGARALAADVAAAAAASGGASADPIAASLAAVQTAFGRLAANPTSTALQTAYAAAVAAADAAAPAQCPAARGNTLLLQLRCFELLDVARWLSHLAKDAVFDPAFARASPRMFDPSLGRFTPLADPYYQQPGGSAGGADFFGAEAAPLRAGPFLRCTLREYLEVGCHDNAADYLLALLGLAAPGAPGSRLPPVAPVSWEGAAQDEAWATHVRTGAPRRRRAGTAESVYGVDEIVAEAVGAAAVSDVAAWGGPRGDANATTSPVTGSFSGGAFRPTLNLASQDLSAAAARPALAVWLAPALRAASLGFVAAVQDVRGAGVQLWRYMLPVPVAAGAGAAGDSDAPAAVWAGALPRMKSDDEASTPACAASLRATSNNVSLFWAPPYFYGCRSNGLLGAPVPGYAWSDTGSAAALRIESSPERGLVSLVDVEPISGRALLSHRRLGAHLLWGPSLWFPLRRTYGALFWQDEHSTATADYAAVLAGVQNVQRVARNILGSLVGLGVMLALAGAVGLRSALHKEPKSAAAPLAIVSAAGSGADGGDGGNAPPVVVVPNVAAAAPAVAK